VLARWAFWCFGRPSERAALAAGEWLAVFGGGGVGTSALILGRALGARVIVVDVVQ
jgi:D-arabinose 1-dehydrogenase-like Zn-dependent alcohol dehydrogenase